MATGSAVSDFQGTAVQDITTKGPFAKSVSGASVQEGPSPKPGDLVEFVHPFYQHWGIYVGSGYVVHVTGQECWSIMKSAFGATAVVRKDRLNKTACNLNYSVNNKYDQKKRPRSPQEVVRAALEQVGNEIPYNVTTANCEHFVTALRYGNSFSDQSA
ncbi:phospholipase A and acyltransferase 3-like [Discoglossus pictus]